MPETYDDPTQITVQLNVGIPWQIRKDLTEIAKDKKLSLSAMCRDAIERKYRAELHEKKMERKRGEVKLSDEQAQDQGGQG